MQFLTNKPLFSKKALRIRNFISVLGLVDSAAARPNSP
jgi:hypothetical protein